MSVCGAGSSPVLETVAGTSSVLRLTAVGADGNPMDLTGVAVEMRVGVSVNPLSTPTYSTGLGSIAVVAPASQGVFQVTTSAAADATAGFYDYLITVTPAGGAPSLLAHGVYGVAGLNYPPPTPAAYSTAVYG